MPAPEWQCNPLRRASVGRHMRPVILLLFSSAVLFAQPFTAGIKAGVPFTDFLHAAQNQELGYTAPMQHYIIGGTAEVHLPLGFAIEFDALYRHLEYTAIHSATTTSGGNWEFPLLVKYRFAFPVVRPYVDGGIAWNHLALSTPEVVKNTTPGIVLGGGIDIHAIFLHISPEVRYTHWNNAQISDTNGLLHSNQNQAEFLVGFTF
jgi:hypothetical protein